jgi:hypothetical protein
MSQTQDYPTPSDGWAAWITFAAVILTLIGTLTAVQGFVALFEEGYFLAGGDDGLLLVDYMAWGIVMLLWGAFVLFTGFSLVNGHGWARWLAVFAVFMNVLFQIGFLAAFPIWSALMILLDVLVIFALTARWSEARAAM